MFSIFLMINICTASVLSAHVCEDVTIDVAFMVDISASALVTRDNDRSFAQDFVKGFFDTMPPGRARMSFIIFSDACRQLIHLDQGTSFEQFKQVLVEAPWFPVGVAKMTPCVDYACQHILKKNASVSSAIRVIVLLSETVSKDENKELFASIVRQCDVNDIRIIVVSAEPMDEDPTLKALGNLMWLSRSNLDNTKQINAVQLIEQICGTVCGSTATQMKPCSYAIEDPICRRVVEQKPFNKSKAACKFAKPRSLVQDCGFATCIALCDEFRWSSWSPRQCCGYVGSRVLRSRSRQLPPHLKHATLCTEQETSSCTVQGICEDDLRAEVKARRLFFNIVYACVLAALLFFSLVVLWLLCTTRQRVVDRFLQRSLTRAGKKISLPLKDVEGRTLGVSANLPVKASKSVTSSSSSSASEKKNKKKT